MAPVPTEVKYENTGESRPEDAFQPTMPDVASPGSSDPQSSGHRKKCVVVGLGMVGIAFVEKLLKYDIDGGRDEWEVVV